MRTALAGLLGAGVLATAGLGAQEPERAPFITTPEEVVARMLRFAGAGPQDVVADLGSGDGRIVIAAAREFGARGLGVELDAALVEKSRANARAAGVEGRVRFVQGDVLLADFSQASVVTVYLLPSLINRLQPRLLDELAPGTRIVSHAFAMVGWNADRSLTMPLGQRHEGQGDYSTLHLWVVPAKARGLWREAGKSAGWQLRIQQNFQKIEVEAHLGRVPVALSDAGLSGRQIEWKSSHGHFRGRVEGDRMTGELVRGGTAAPLVLLRAP